MPGRANFSAQALASPEFISGRNAAVKASRSLAIRVDGLATVRKVLQSTDKEAAKALRLGLKDAALIITTLAREKAPRRTGALAASIRPVVQGKNVAIRSTLPYANVIHWGGSTGRGHRPGVAWSGSTLIHPSLFITRALEESETRVMVRIEQAMDTALIRAGWR